MKAELTILLIFSIGGLTVEALQCYQCSGASTNTQCNSNIQNCTDLLDTCMTTVTQLVGLQSISKTCSTSVLCTASNVNVGIAGNRVTCCQTDLCNSSALSQLNLLLLGLPTAMMGLGLVKG